MSIIKFLLAVVSILFFTACSKQTTTTQCFKAKRLHSICNDIIFEIRDPNFQHLGQANWTDAITGNTYNGVFEQKNNCNNIVVDANNEATVKIINDTNVADCLFCLALYPGTLPNKKLSITNCP
jgi:uncharacterized lipoprotein YajG